MEELLNAYRNEIIENATKKAKMLAIIEDEIDTTFDYLNEIDTEERIVSIVEIKNAYRMQGIVEGLICAYEKLYKEKLLSEDETPLLESTLYSYKYNVATVYKMKLGKEI